MNIDDNTKEVIKEIVKENNLPDTMYKSLVQMISTTFGPVAKEIGGLMGDSVKRRRQKNLITHIIMVQKMIYGSGLNPRQLNLKTLVPFIESASLEEDPSMQEMWVKLISSISTKEATGMESKLVRTMSNLTSLEAEVLNTFFVFIEKKQKIMADQFQQKDKVISIGGDDITFAELLEELELGVSLLDLAMNGLENLDLIRQLEGMKENYIHGRKVSSIQYQKTTYGVFFIKSCGGPIVKGTSSESNPS